MELVQSIDYQFCRREDLDERTLVECLFRWRGLAVGAGDDADLVSRCRQFIVNGDFLTHSSWVLRRVVHTVVRGELDGRLHIATQEHSCSWLVLQDKGVLWELGWDGAEQEFPLVPDWMPVE